MGAGIGLLLPWENEIEGTGTGIWALGMGKNVKMGMGQIFFKHWEVGFVKNMGWEMGLEPPLFRTLR